MPETLTHSVASTHPTPEEGFETLLSEISDNRIDTDLLRTAFDYSTQKHQHHFRKSGQPFVQHCIEVARLLQDMRMDTQTLVAAMIHDVIEDTDTKIEEIAEKFGPEVAIIVDGVTKISALKLRSTEVQQAENFRKMLVSMAQDIRVILVKFADRLHNMRTLEHLPKEKRQRIARETRDVYAPLAHRLGIARIKWELEDLSFKHLNPEQYEAISRKVNMKREERQKCIDEFVGPLNRKLTEAEIEGRILGRPKHYYSIFRKMERQEVSFEDIYDLLAIRIIVRTTNECYSVMGLLHELYTPVSNRFRDFIGSPKANRYQSLHTTVVTDDGQRVEIQIRTEQMHQLAEEGIAAHWAYKEETTGSDKPDQYEQRMRWLRHFLEWSEGVTDPVEFMGQLRADLPHDEVYVFSPKGDVFELPKGATVLDFAFAVHSEVGLRTVMAKVTGQIVPLHYALNSGDKVEVITSSDQMPTRDWEGMVVTAKAKNRIHRFLRTQEHQASVALGRQLLERGLRNLHVALTEADWKDISSALNYESPEDMYGAVGAGDVSLTNVLYLAVPRARELDSPLPVKKDTSGETTDLPAVDIAGVDRSMIRMAKCCKPVRGDPIAGFITRGPSVSIHRIDCPNIRTLVEEGDKLIEVDWEESHGDNNAAFSADFIIKGSERMGLVNDATGVIRKFGANITAMEFKSHEHRYYGRLTLLVNHTGQLERLMKGLRKIKGVEQVERTVDLSASEMADWPIALKSFPSDPQMPSEELD